MTSTEAPTRYFEDFAAGQFVDCGTRRLSRDEIVAFAAEFDPQPMHLDEAAAETSLLGGLAASGWHTCATIMRMICDGYLLDTASEGGPGVEEVRWLAPVRPDVPLTLTMEVLEARPSSSRPALGVVTNRYALTSAGETLCTMRSVGMIRRRGATAEEIAAMRAGGGASLGREPEPEAAQYATAVAPEAAPEWLDPTTPPFGRPIALGEEAMDAERIVAFARRYDPQPFHVDPVAAESSLLGGLCASGWHTATLWMRRLVDSRDQALAAAPEADRARLFAGFGPSPGFQKLRWRRPVFVGDVLRFYITPLTRRALRSRPGWSVLGSESAVLNQWDQRVMTFESSVFSKGQIDDA